MPPVEFDTIPRFASHSAQDAKESFPPSDVLELGSFESIKTRSKGLSLNDSGMIKDVDIPEIDSEDETTADKIMKDYSEEESSDDSDYVPSEDSEDELELSMITRSASKGASLNDSELIKDVEVPEVDSEDETTIDKILKNYSEDEDVASDDDADYVPSEDSDDELEFDSDASISDEENDVIEDVMVPEVVFTRAKVVIQDVKIPEVSNHVIKDLHVGHTEQDSFSELVAIAHNALDLAASYSVVQAGIQTLDFGLDFCEKIVAPVSVSYKENIQSVRRHLRAVRRSGSGPSRKGIVAHFVELFKVNWFLSLIGLTLTVGTDSVSEKKSAGKSNDSQDYCDDESTVYKLMQEYDSQDDEDYVPSDCSEDSLEFESDCSDDETIVDKIMKDYSETEDSDYAPSVDSEEGEDSLEFDSDAEVSDDSDYDSSDAEDSEDEDCSEDETLLEKIMKDYSEEESDFDSDYCPDEEVEDVEYDSDSSVTDDSDASVTETEDSESEESESEESGTEEESQDEVCDEVEHEGIEEEIVDELESQDSQLDDDVDESESQDSQLDDE